MKPVLLSFFFVITVVGCSKTDFSGVGGNTPSASSVPSPTPSSGTDLDGPDTTPDPGSPNPGPGVGNVVYDGKLFTACASSQMGTLRAGQLACFGVWEYGNTFGSDPFMCSTTANPYDAYQYPGIGCEVRIPLCASGRAQAVQAFNVADPSNILPHAPSNEIQLLADYLQVTAAVASREIVRFWKYACL